MCVVVGFRGRNFRLPNHVHWFSAFRGRNMRLPNVVRASAQRDVAVDARLFGICTSVRVHAVRQSKITATNSPETLYVVRQTIIPASNCLGTLHAVRQSKITAVNRVRSRVGGRQEFSIPAAAHAFLRHSNLVRTHRPDAWESLYLRTFLWGVWKSGQQPSSRRYRKYLPENGGIPCANRRYRKFLPPGFTCEFAVEF